MSANRLLLWMSARGSGSWQQYRAAAEELHVEDGDPPSISDEEAGTSGELPLYQDIRLAFQRLGHAEFFAGAGGPEWRVTPPALAVSRAAGGWLGILCGARTPRLLASIRVAANHLAVRSLEFPRCPDQMLIDGASADELAEVAAKSGIAFQLDAPTALLGCIPAVDDRAVAVPYDLPFGVAWKIERLSAEGYSWRPSTREEAGTTHGGLFRFTLQHRRHILFCSGGRAASVPLQVGKYLVLRRRRLRVMRYDPATETLVVPANFRPPFLVERALILCSGTPPKYREESRRGMLEYAQVPFGIARASAQILRQEFA